MCTKNLIKAVVIGVIGLFFIQPSYAATYYVRVDGGTATQCTGLADAAYPGSGSNQACAFNHPNWAIAPQGNNPTKMVGGDTLIIDGSNGAQYKMGLGSPNTNDTGKCYANWPWDCYLRPVPSGSDAAHPTRILGKGYDTGCANPPQLWGNERLKYVINLMGSNNVELQCLEITDHSSCQYMGKAPCNNTTIPYGPWAITGVEAADSSNVYMKNINVHGLYRGFHAGRLRDWTLEDTKIVGNSFVGWDGDIGANNSSNSGTMTFTRTEIAFNGCGEQYPANTPYNCYSQDQGGYGDGLGTHKTGGNWIFNNSDISHNVSDGLDLLYHDGTGTIAIKRSRFEGNAGNQVKIATSAVIENSLLIGNCAYFNNNPITWNSSTFNNCRAGGDTLAISSQLGNSWKLINNTFYSQGDAQVLLVNNTNTCNGTESFYARNNIFVGAPYFNTPSLKARLYAEGRGGVCVTPLDTDYSTIYNVQSDTCPSGSHNLCSTDPQFIGPLSGNNYNVYLKSTSPVLNRASTITGMSTLDFNSYDRGTTWDIGSLEYGSAPGGTPPDPVCGDAVCDNNETCSTCSGDCGACAPVCGDGSCSGAETCSSCSTDCGACPPVCGDGTCNGAETCGTCPGDCGACACVPNGSCSAATPACGQTTAGVDNCGNPCTRTGEECACVPTWCSAPIQNCNLPPLTGVDSCGNPCTKPSPQWPNCIACVPNGSCSAATPACGQTTTGVDNCGDTCTKVGDACACVPNGSCSAATPACGQTTTGVDNCGNVCTRTGAACCVPNGSCSAATPACEETTVGSDNCGNTCTKTGGACPVSQCGNGIKESGEGCDDGNLVNGDGCSNTCEIETASTPPQCGNGIKEGSEQCDDGNRRSGDGCSRYCKTEAVCGNGIKEGSEQCDDGNRRNYDGCSRSCKLEGARRR